MKRKNTYWTILIIALIIIVIFFLKNDSKELAQQSITVCQAPEVCKTVMGASAEDIHNRLGSPADFHREASNIKVDTDEDFIKGYFDEKTFYYRSGSTVFYFINAKIRTGFYEDTGALEGSDTDSFEIIDANFSKDKNQVYNRPSLDISIAYEVLVEADPTSFVPLDFPYAKDKNQVYYLNRPIPQADPTSFAVLDNKVCGQDKNNFYLDGEIASKEQCEK